MVEAETPPRATVNNAGQARVLPTQAAFRIHMLFLKTMLRRLYSITRMPSGFCDKMTAVEA